MKTIGLRCLLLAVVPALLVACGGGGGGGTGGGTGAVLEEDPANNNTPVEVQAIDASIVGIESIGEFTPSLRLCENCLSFESFNGQFLVKFYPDDRVSSNFVGYTVNGDITDPFTRQSWSPTSRSESFNGSRGSLAVISYGLIGSSLIHDAQTGTYIRPRDVYAGEIGNLLINRLDGISATGINSSGDVLAFAEGRKQTVVMFDVFNNPRTINLPGEITLDGDSTPTPLNRVTYPGCIYDDGNSGTASIRPGFPAGTITDTPQGYIYFEGLKTGAFSWRYIVDDAYASVFADECITTPQGRKVVFSLGPLYDAGGEVSELGEWLEVDGVLLDLGAQASRVQKVTELGYAVSSDDGGCEFRNYNHIPIGQLPEGCRDLVFDFSDIGSPRICIASTPDLEARGIDLACAPVTLITTSNQ